MAGWDSFKDLVKEEIKQKQDEGSNVEGFLEKVEAAGDDEEQLMVVYRKLMAQPVAADFPYVEPNELEDIRRERPVGPRQSSSALSDEQWRDKFYGAWLGRSAGCALGKSLECGPFMFGSGDRPGWKNVMLWFQGANAWPIANYTPGKSSAKEEYGFDVNQEFGHKSFLENIKCMESDDDIRYTVLGLIMLEEKGLDWETWDVGKLWHSRLRFYQVATAETKAYLNFAHLSCYMNQEKPQDWPEKKDWVRTFKNPYREWIGAQIRVDGLAYGAAGNPELAADLAWRDASFSHTKNGIYGAMFVAAMIAASFVETDNEKIIEAGLSEIPKNCRLAHDVRKAVEIAKSAKDQVELVDRIWEAFKHYHPVHTNNNAALVAATLLFAGDNYELGITTAVLGGWDTDCNGATVGSILGAKLGAKRIPEKWAAPLNDTLYSEVIDFHPIAISECARRSYEVFRKLRG